MIISQFLKRERLSEFCLKTYILNTKAPAGKFEREETHVYLWLIHVDVWQKPSQYCKAIILQLKIKENVKIYI